MKTKYKIIAHRGIFNNQDIPENSIKAFQKAIELNIPFELDIQLTKDNILVVFHDENLKRMTGINKNISDLTYKEIRELNLLNTKEKIPTLKEVLKLNKEKVLMDIEIKNTKKIKQIVQILIKELKNYKNFTLKSFNPRIVRYIKRNYQNLEIGFLITDQYHKKILNIILPNKKMIQYSKADFISINKRLLHNNKFKKLIKEYPTQIWTIKKEEELTDKKLIYICNNLPY